LPESETTPPEGADTATLTIEPDVPEAATLTDAPEEQEPVDAPAQEHTEYDAVFSEEDIQRWTEEESDLAGPLALFSAVVLQKVRNYPAWRTKFDQQLEGRKQAGFAAQGILRGVEDGNMVGVWLAVTDVPHAKAFFAKAWRRLGVKARVKLSRNLAAEIPPDRENLSAAIVTLKLEELAYFRSAFDATAQARADAGLVGYSLGQDVDDEQIVYAYLQSEQPEALKAYLSSRETRRIWKDAGVLQIQSITLFREGELMRCR
jgi:quinol monooxygenase YgiN